MVIQFPADIEELNETDMDVLMSLQEAGAMWKMEITRQVNRRRGGNMLVERKKSITKQAVSRRVQRLHELGYLENSIIPLSGQEVEKKPERDFIEGYDITGKGEKALEETVRKILRDAAAAAIDDELEGGLEPFLDVYSSFNQEADSLLEFVELEMGDSTGEEGDSRGD